MDYLQKSDEQIEKDYNTDLKSGLSKIEAQERLNKYGKNELPKAKRKSWVLILLLAFVEPLQLILISVAVISVIFPLLTNNWHAEPTDFIDFVVIFLIVCIDAVLETIQTVRANKSMEALKSLSKPQCVVLRDGLQMEINASELVVGDVVVLETGRYIPAELRIIEAQDLAIDESILTGESVPVEKTDEPLAQETDILAEMVNVAFMGTYVTAGRAIGVVIKTAKDSEIGKIASDVANNAENETPLERKLSKFSMWIALLSLVLAIIIFVALFLMGQHELWVSYLMVAVTLAIGVIPESLSAVVSITLSLSTKRMANEHVIVKQLASVETLGSVNVICTDKTGTLTQNKMTVTKVIVDNKIMSSGEFIKDAADKHKDLFLKALVLPNDSVTEKSERIGDPTELALVDYADLMGYDEQLSRLKWKRIDEIPFDSERKLMTTVNDVDGELHTFTKGAIDQIIKACDEILIDNKVQKMTPEIAKNLFAKADELSQQALRVLAFAYNTDYKDEPDKDDIEKNLIFIGAVAMIDPVRVEAIEAVQQSHQAGIKVVMITGDHATTALAIAKDLNLADKPEQVLSSDKLSKMSDEQLAEIISDISVFARVNPEHKVRIVNALQAKNNVVSMTGDGVNDAPSLAKSDVGVAMGITGTDVAKEASNVILTDDNFATIIKGVNEGRNVFQKIKRAIVLLLGVNFSNALSIFLLSMITSVSPLEATDILWINLIVESILAISLGMGPNDKSLMQLKPMPRNISLLNGLWLPILKIVIFNSIAGIGAFYLGQIYWLDGFNVESFVNANNLNNGTMGWTEVLKIKASDFAKYNGTAGNTFENLKQLQLNATVFGRTTMFLVVTCSPCLYANFIKLTNWRASKNINWLINKPLVMASALSASLNLVILFIPTINSEVFNLVSLDEWTSSNALIILFAFALVFAQNGCILLWDLITFTSYHYNVQSRIRNRSIAMQVEQEVNNKISKKSRQ